MQTRVTDTRLWALQRAPDHRFAVSAPPLCDAILNQKVRSTFYNKYAQDCKPGSVFDLLLAQRIGGDHSSRAGITPSLKRSYPGA